MDRSPRGRDPDVDGVQRQLKILLHTMAYLLRGRVFSASLAVLGLVFLFLVSPGTSRAGDDFDDPFADLQALGDEELAEARGGAVSLPNGMTIEVTGSMKLLADGQEIAAGMMPGMDIGELALDHATQNLDLAGQDAIVNSLDGISLDQYREINFFISNIPKNVLSSQFLPEPEINSSLAP